MGEITVGKKNNLPNHQQHISVESLQFSLIMDFSLIQFWSDLSKAEIWVYIAHISPFTCGFISLDTDKWTVGVIVMWTRGWSPAVTGQERLCERISVNSESELDSPVCILVLLIQSVRTNTGGAWDKNDVFQSSHSGGFTEGKHVDFTFQDTYHLFSPAQFCCVLIRSLQYIN